MVLLEHVSKEIEGLSSTSKLENLSLIRSRDPSSSRQKNREGQADESKKF